MKYQYLNYKESNEGVAFIHLNRPKVHNAFNDELIAEITDCISKVYTRASIRMVVIKGEGPSFCAGADLNWMRSMKDNSYEENQEDSQKMADMFFAIDQCPKPVIAIVHGNVLGGGVGLVAVCDYVVADPSTVFGFTETRLGLIPSVISPYVIQKIGVSMARAYFLSGTKFDAHKAYEMRLVHQLEASPFDADSILKSFLKAGPDAVGKAKELIKKVHTLNNKPHKDELIKYTVDTIASCRVSDEAQEGMAALLDKRKASWNGGQNGN